MPQQNHRMRWLAYTNHRTLGPGARFYIQEAIHVVGEPRPPYLAGDVFNVAPGNGPHVAGEILEAGRNRLVVEIHGHGTLELAPTPADALPPGLSSDIPFEDWTAVNPTRSAVAPGR